MRKIFLFFAASLYIFASYSTKAEYIDYLSGSIRYSFGYQMAISNSGNTNFIYTGGINLDTTKKLYVKSLDCMFRNYRTSISPLEYEISLSPNSSLTQNYFRSYERLGTGTAIYKKFDIYQIMTGSVLYFQNRLFFDTGSISNAFLATCYINGTYFPDYINLLSNGFDMGTGAIVINNNISNETINIFQSDNSMKEFYIFEFIFIMLLMITAFLFRLIKF